MSETGTVVNPYRYAGYRYDKETGLYYLQARYYNPSTGRFLTRDAFDGDKNDPLSLNKYTYTENNPVMYSDPSGHFTMLIGAAIGGALNVLPMALSTLWKYSFKGFMKHMNWRKFIWSFAVGAIVGAVGAWWAGVILRATINIAYRILALAVFSMHAYIANTLANGQRPTAWGLALAGIHSPYMKATDGWGKLLRFLKGKVAAYKFW